jgi:hypothetical protein
MSTSGNSGAARDPQLESAAGSRDGVTSCVETARLGAVTSSRLRLGLSQERYEHQGVLGDPREWGHHNLTEAALWDHLPDPDALRRAAAAIVVAHPVLGARLRRDRDGWFHDTSSPVDPAVELGLAPDTAPDPFAAARAVARRLARAPIDLADGPLLRISAVTFGGRRCIIMLTSSHVVIDGASFAPLWRSFVEGYAAHPSGGSAVAGSSGRAYAAFLDWETEVSRSNGEYWRERLRGAPATLCPADHVRGGRIVSARHAITLPGDTAEAVVRTARTLAITPFVLLLMCYALTLAHTFDTSQMTIGVEISGRRARDRRVVGHLFRNVPMIFDIGPTREFGDACRHLQRDLALAIKHGAVSDRLLYELAPANFGWISMWNYDQASDRLLGEAPLRPIALNAPLTGTSASAVRRDEGIGVTWTSFGRAGARGALCYNAVHYDLATVTRLAETMKRMIDVATQGGLHDGFRRLLGSV